MAKDWTDIPITKVDAESVVNEGLLADMHGNQECLITQQHDTRFGEVKLLSGEAGATWINKVSIEDYIPPAVNTQAGDVTLIVRIQVKVDTGITGKVRIRLGTGSYVESADFTNTSYQFITLTISSTDVKTAKDSSPNFEVDLQRVSGSGGDVYARCVSSSSRIARAA